MEPRRTDTEDPFWQQFCGSITPDTLWNPLLLLWGGMPPPSVGFTCPQHAASLAASSLFALCTMSHILVLRSKPIHGHHREDGEDATSADGVQGEEGGAKEEAPKVLKVLHLFWISIALSLAAALAWGGLALWLVYPCFLHPTRSYCKQVGLHQVAFLAAQALSWLVVACSFWACHSRQLTRLFSTARVFFLVNALLFLIVAPISLIRLISFPASALGTSFPEDLLTVLSLPIAVFFGYVGYTGSPGLELIRVHLDPLTRPLLESSEAQDEPKLCDTVTGFETSGLFGTTMFSFAVPVLERGAEKVLNQDDVPQLRPSDLSLPVFQSFDANWRRIQAVHPERPPRVALTLWSTFYPILITTAILALFQTCFIFAGPLLLPYFVEYAGRGDADADSQGFLLVFYLFLATALGTVFSAQQNFRSELMGMRIQSALVGMLFQKGLRLTSKAKQENSVGEIVNYMSTDTQRLKDLCWELNNIWVLPLQIVVALVILFHVVGMSMLAGLGVMVGIMLLNLLVATQQQASMAQVMERKDARLKATTEALKSMRVIKLYAWQEQFEGQIRALRKGELSWLAQFMYICAINIFLLWLSPLAVSVATFAAMVWLGHPLTPGAVFTAIATFRILQEPLRSFPGVISAATQALVSLKRLSTFLGSPELQRDAVLHLPLDAPPPPAAPSAADVSSDVSGSELAVEIDDASFSWEDDSGNVTLSGINLRVRRGARVAVCGAVGAGKSSLLACILGEVPKLQGKVTVWGTTAYVPQTAWIQNCTVRENILFGEPYDEARYKEALRCCSLEKDLALFSHGDETQIGERGVNLSGGQKQRIQLARALYHGADVFLLDDPFSAVDAHTGSELFMEYILGALQGKTIILVTHQVEFLPAADVILVMKDGAIVQSGSFEELSEAGTDLAGLVEAHEEAMKSVESSQSLHRLADGAPEAADGDAANGESHGAGGPDKAGPSHGGSGPAGDAEDGDEERDPQSGQLIQDEEKESGQVSPEIYWAYVTKALGGALVPILLLIQLAWQALQIGSDYWLAAYTSGTAGTTDQRQFLRIYSLLALGSGAFVLFRTFAISWAGLAITQGFYTDMLHAVFRAPMAFFDSTPIGRILSRSSTDQGTLDLDIPFSFGSLLAMCFSLFGILFVCSFITWPVLFAVIPLTYLYVSFKDYYLASSRELTRLNGITRAPIIEHFSESLSGAAVIRAFGQQERFAAKSRERVDTNNRIYFYYGATTMWMGVHLELIGASLLCFTALMLISLPSSVITPGLAGMSLSYGLALSQGLFFVVWVWCALENEMVSVERIRQYSKLPSEAPLTLPDKELPAHWPAEGHVVFDHIDVRYREDMPLVLKGVSIDIAPSAKVGVVGRTGSGKSTLVSALFRIVEPCGGAILIDGVNILTDVGLADLRSHLSIIPQDPTLFEGSVRYNLDPLGQYEDDEIWEALRKCQLADAVGGYEEKLDSQVTEGGENWSVGQRQLFCLGRALLKKSRVIVLDEATASVDSATDAVIQKTIRDSFGQCTVISIAHRIPTVMDSDRVLVMSQGEAAEYDTPAKLLSDPSSLFFKLVAEYSARSSDMAEVARSSSVENLSSIGG